MLNKELIVKTYPVANKKNIVFWRDYRVTVLSDRLFRIEKSKNQVYRDEATLSVWYRNMPVTEYAFSGEKDKATIKTKSVTLVLKPRRSECEIIIGDKTLRITNEGNLGGTYRTLDRCNGDRFIGDHGKWHRVDLGYGVCSTTGVAVLDDSKTICLGDDGKPFDKKADGTDEYVFAFGDNYREAVKALYSITGYVPMIPRFALGNWWSRYHAYSDREYLALMSKFENENVPFTVATVDMDWHYSTTTDQEFKITERGLADAYHGYTSGWTGYTWNRHLFPDYKKFLKVLNDKNLKVTLNLHPHSGVRFWETQYEKFAKRCGVDPKTGKQIECDVTDENFINAYFDVLLNPYEKDGVRFWWMDWQQGTRTKIDGLDPLWAFNHYLYLDNAKGGKQPIILSRYAGIGSHRYQVGFSGDTHITWETLKYLPYFTATSSNVGYTWWSHDIGGHMQGYKDDELYVRSVQFGVFSPINRLHCTCEEVHSKDPEVFKNGAGLIVNNWLRLRHSMIPYVYSAVAKNHLFGLGIVEPLYYEWKEEKAYESKDEYLFNQDLLVGIITEKINADGLAAMDMYIPEGTWTDIFTGDVYESEGKTVTVQRTLDSIPVLASEGTVITLSRDDKNKSDNPDNLELWVYNGNKTNVMYESGEKDFGCTVMTSSYTEKDNGEYTEKLTIEFGGDNTAVPKNRNVVVRFKNIKDGKVSFRVNSEKREYTEVYDKNIALSFDVESTADVIEIEVKSHVETKLDRFKEKALEQLTMFNYKNAEKVTLFNNINSCDKLEDAIKYLDDSFVTESVRNRIKEVI